MGAENFGDFSESDNAIIEEAFKIMSSQRNITRVIININTYKK